MKQIFRASLAAFSLLCGCATGYHERGLGGGYSETQLGKNIFQVNFRGNGYTSGERASDFALLRAAEVTMENGFSFFMLGDTEKDNSVSAYTSPTFSNTSISNGRAYTTTYGGQTNYVSKPGRSNTIVCFAEKPDNPTALVFEASYVVKSIRKKYDLEPNNNGRSQ